MITEPAGTWIKVHDQMPSHPKIEGLSDRGFRLLVSTWCWCSQHLTDGHIRADVWRKRGTPASRRELVAAGLIEEREDGSAQAHDYLDWQRSAAEAAEAIEAKKAAGQKGNHERWHVRAGKPDRDCALCRSGQNGSQVRSHLRSV